MPATQIVGGVPAPGSFGTPGIPVVADGSFGAARMSVKPDEFEGGGTIGGHYRVGAVSGALTGVAAGGIVYTFRAPTTPSLWFVLKRVTVSAVITTAFTTAQALDYDIVKATSWTGGDTGGTAIIMSGGGKVRANMPNSQMAQIMIATTAANAAGTPKTLDTNALAEGVISQTNAIGSGGQVDLYKHDATGEHPIVLGSNEGFNIRVVTAMGAVGVVKLYVSTTWVEAPGY